MGFFTFLLSSSKNKVIKKSARFEYKVSWWQRWDFSSFHFSSQQQKELIYIYYKIYTNFSNEVTWWQRWEFSLNYQKNPLSYSYNIRNFHAVNFATFNNLSKLYDAHRASLNNYWRKVLVTNGISKGFSLTCGCHPTRIKFQSVTSTCPSSRYAVASLYSKF